MRTFIQSNEKTYPLTFTELPSESLLTIFSFLSAIDAARAGATCRSLLKIAHTSPVKEKIELEKYLSMGIVITALDTFIWRNFPSSCVVASKGDNQRLWFTDFVDTHTFVPLTLPGNLTRVFEIAATHFRIIIVGADAAGNFMWITSSSRGFIPLRLPKPVFKMLATTQDHYFFGQDRSGQPMAYFLPPGETYAIPMGDRLPRFSPSAFQFEVSIGGNLFLWGLDENAKPLLCGRGPNLSYELGLGTKGERERFERVPLPAEFVEVYGVFTYPKCTLVLGSDAMGKPLIACAGLNSKGRLGISGAAKSAKIFTLAKIPDAFTYVSRPIIGDEGVVLYGMDANGRSLVAASGQDYHKWFVGDEQSHFALVSLPRQFLRIELIFPRQSRLLIGGVDEKNEQVFIMSCAYFEKDKLKFTEVKLGHKFYRFIPATCSEQGFVAAYAFDAQDRAVLALSAKECTQVLLPQSFVSRQRQNPNGFFNTRGPESAELGRTTVCDDQEQPNRKGF